MNITVYTQGITNMPWSGCIEVIITHRTPLFLVSRTLSTRQRCTFLMGRWWYVSGTVRVGWGGVGWSITFKYTSTHTSCYATARFSCTCTHRSCNVGVGWGGGANNNVQVYFYTQVMLRYCTFLLHLHTHTHVMLRLCGYLYQFVYRHIHKD